MADVAKALRQAFNLGQTYWQQADSESYIQHHKSDETRAKFDALVIETLAQLDAVRATPAPGAPGQEAAAGWNWQDMRSAPKNGAECLLDTLECGLVVAYWDSFDVPPMWRNGFDDSKLTPVRWSVLPPRIHGRLEALPPSGAGEKTS